MQYAETRKRVEDFDAFVKSQAAARREECETFPNQRDLFLHEDLAAQEVSSVPRRAQTSDTSVTTGSSILVITINFSSRVSFVQMEF